jgi:hypothetical protein
LFLYCAYRIISCCYCWKKTKKTETQYVNVYYNQRIKFWCSSSWLQKLGKWSPRWCHFFTVKIFNKYVLHLFSVMWEQVWVMPWHMCVPLIGWTYIPV